MVMIGGPTQGLGGVAAYRAAGRRAASGGFRLPLDGAGEAVQADAPARTGTVSAPSLLGLQEAQQDAVTDREARRHAEEALDTLKELQLALLGRKGSGREGMERMAQAVPDAADPRLRAVQHALRLRVAVEQARHRAAASL